MKIKTCNVRDSQFELLRIIAMFFVVMGHLLIKGADTIGLTSPYSIEKDGVVGVLLYSFVVGGVNLFVLITGWYGVKRVWGGMVRLVIDCMVFGAFSYMLLILLSDGPFSVKEFFHSMMFTTNWFVVSYMMLLLVAPLIEYTLKGCSILQLKIWLILLTIFNLVFGYVLGWVNKDGYNVVQFVWLYYIARYLKLTIDRYWNCKLRDWGFAIYICMSVILAIVFVLINYLGYFINTIRWFSYNNPILILSCVGLFMWLSRFSFKNKLINIVATGVFGIFLLHTTPAVIPFRNAVSSVIFSNYSYWGILVETLAIMFFGCVISLLLNNVNWPIIKHVNDKCEKYFKSTEGIEKRSDNLI